MLAPTTQGGSVSLADSLALMQNIAAIITAYSKPDEIKAALAQVEDAIAREAQAKSDAMAASIAAKNDRKDADDRIEVARNTELEMTQRKAALDKETARRDEIFIRQQNTTKEAEAALKQRSDDVAAKERAFESRERKTENEFAIANEALKNRESAVAAREKSVSTAELRVLDQQRSVSALEADLKSRLAKMREPAL